MSYINKIRIQGVNGTINTDINIKEVEFYGIGNWGYGNRNIDNNIINISTNLILSDPSNISNFINNNNNDTNNIIFTNHTLTTNDFIDFNLIGTDTKPFITNGISSLKLYWFPNDYTYVSDERLYPHSNAKSTSFLKIDGISPDNYNISNNTYGNGEYIINYSSYFKELINGVLVYNYSPNLIFSSFNNYSKWEDNKYSSGIYIGIDDLNSDNYKGDWVSIKMPISIVPTKIIFNSLNSTENLNRLPRKYRFYGSNNGINWNIILDETLNDNNYTTDNNFIVYIKLITSSLKYNNFALVINEIGNDNILSIANFEIYGIEILDNIPSTYGTWNLILYDEIGNDFVLDNFTLSNTDIIYETQDSNLLYYNEFKFTLLGEERLYPPFFVRNIIDYYDIIIKDKIYGNGNYYISWSSSFNSTNTPLNIFNNNNEQAIFGENNYTYNNSYKSSYNGSTNNIDSNYNGDWIKIQLPYSILLTKFIISYHNSSTNGTITNNAIHYFPNNFSIYGSIDGIIWEKIINKNINRFDLNDNYNNINNNISAYKYSILDTERLTNLKLFDYFALIINEIGGATNINISSWDIYGKELNIPLSNRPTNIPLKKNIKFSQLAKVYRIDIEFNNGMNLDDKNIKLSDYYFNGSYIYDNPINENIPTIGSELSLSDFKGTTNVFLSVPFKNNLYAHYNIDFDSSILKSGTTITKWYDLSGNSRDINIYRGNPIKTSFSKGFNGLKGVGSISVIQGDKDSGFALPFQLPILYTFCYIARFVGDKNNTQYNRRIFDARTGSGQNTYWGFNNNPCISFNSDSGYISVNSSQISDPDNWIIGIETSTSARYNGMDCTDYNTNSGISYPKATSSLFRPTVSINYGHNTGQDSGNANHTSNWEVIELIFYNKELNNTEKKDVEEYLSTKYEHISFKNVIPTLNDFKLLSQTGLENESIYIYDGFKYAYNTIYYGPAGPKFDFYIYNNSSYWIHRFLNNNINTHDGYSNRNNSSSQIQYDITLPLSAITYKVHMVVGGAGGGGGRTYGSGGGAGGMAYITNITTLQNTTLNILLSGLGQAGSLSQNGQDSTSGGDGKITWNTDNFIIGKGGNEGADNFSYSKSTLGGAYLYDNEFTGQADTTSRISKIKMIGVSGTRDQNPDIREFEFEGLGGWGSGDRRTGIYQIDVSTNINTGYFPTSPYIDLNAWVNGSNRSGDPNSRYLYGDNVSVNNSYIEFNFVGSATKPLATDFTKFLIYYDRNDISIDNDQGTWEICIYDQNNNILSFETITLKESLIMTEYSTDIITEKEEFTNAVGSTTTSMSGFNSNLFINGSIGASNIVGSFGQISGSYSSYATIVVASGSGSGSSGNFNSLSSTGRAKYLLLVGGSNRILRTKDISGILATMTTISFYYIVGTGQNGGNFPENGESLFLEFLDPNGAVITQYTIHQGGYNYLNYSNFTFYLHSLNTTDKTATHVRWIQYSTSFGNFDHYGITDITFNYTFLSTTYHLEFNLPIPTGNIANVVGESGGVGGSSIPNYPQMYSLTPGGLGGAISNVLTNIYFNNTNHIFWNVLDDLFTDWISYNSYYWISAHLFGNYHGAGGRGSGYISADGISGYQDGGQGGPSYVYILIDYNTNQF
jgi:hypothetical protein